MTYNPPPGVRQADVERLSEQIMDGLSSDLASAFQQLSLPEWMVETAMDAIWMDERIDAYVEEHLPDGEDEQ